MKRFGKVVACLAGGLAATTCLSAANGVSAANPYAPVIVRNVFALNPPLPPMPPPSPDPPVKITPNGIMSIFGHLQVLFKVVDPSKSGKSNGDQSYILMEGQRQDDIEVTKINEQKGLVTFNNHGLVQELPLANATATSTPATIPAPARSFGSPVSSGGNNGGFGNRYGGRGNIGERRGMNNGGDNSDNANMDSNLRGIPTRAGQQPAIDPVEQTILIAAQHAKLQQEGDPTAAIYPITEIDADAGVVPTPSPNPSAH